MRDHEFQYSFQDSINSICNYRNDAESVIHFFLDCSLCSNGHDTLLNILSKSDHKFLDSVNSSLTQALLFGNSPFTTNDNTTIINLTIDFVMYTKRFEGPPLSTVIFLPLSLKILPALYH